MDFNEAKVGRPTTYSTDVTDAICEQLALGRSMRTVCEAENMPAMSTVFKWLREHKEFSEQYARAKEESADAMSEEILDISDDGTNDWIERERPDGSTFTALNSEAVQRSRLRVDTRKWIMAKMKPKKYGEKLDLTTNGKDLPTPLAPVTRNDIHPDNSISEDISAD